MIDLHIHTKYSDGLDTLKEMLIHLEKHGVSTISITDHDTTNAYKELDSFDVKSIYSGKIFSGIEITTSFKGHRIEILGYAFDNYQLIDEKINEMNDVDFVPIMKDFRKKLLKLFDELNLKYDDIFSDIDKTINMDRYEKKLYESIVKRNADVKEKMKDEYCSVDESFFRKCITNPSSKFYCNYSQFRPNVIDVINLIHDNGGLCFFAHPFGYALNDALKFTEDLIKYCADNDASLDGLETYYYDFNQNQINQLLSLAEKYSLFISGGSDCHGIYKEKKSILGKYLRGDKNIEMENIGTWLNELIPFNDKKLD